MTTEVDPLAISKTVVEVQWHIVCGAMEIEELTRRSKIHEWQSGNDRHSLFLAIKHPNQRFFKGSWGPELLYFDRQGDEYLGRCGRVYCTYDRYKQIAEWFLVNMFDA